MITAEIYAHVLSAVRLLIQDKEYQAGTENLDALVHGALWPYVTHATREIYPSSVAPEAAAPKRDGRSKTWQCIVRFGVASTIGPDPWELIAETEPETIQGTGILPDIIERYATEMHPDDATFPSALTQSAIKERLPQLRNNLGRQDRATLRIEYTVDGVSYLCQVDVSKPGA